MPDTATFAAIALSYLLGAIPFSFLIGKLVYGVDIRTIGSGNVGATNLGRACGVRAGVAGLILDAAKGWAAVTAGGLAAGPIAGTSRLHLLIFGCAAIVGHMAPIFLAGRGGGKGVATGAGVFLAIDPPALGCALAVFVATVGISRFASLGSVLASLSLPAVLLARDRQPRDPVFLLSIPIALAILWKHRENLVRIANGTERRIERHAPGAPAAEPPA